MHTNNKTFSPTIQLTISYTLIIMFLSFIFSIVIYTISFNQINSTLRRQNDRVSRVLPNTQSRSLLLPQPVPIEEELNTAEAQLRLGLAYFNIVILLFGGAVSYVLARRTLAPIEEALRAQSRFTADASHELRTPLAVMQSEIEVALRDKNISKAQSVELLQSNLEEVKKLTKLSNHLLALAQSNANSTELVKTNSTELVKMFKSTLAGVVKSSKAKLRYDSTSFNVYVNKESLNELVLILVDNAIKYGDILKPITLSFTKSNYNAYLKVKNYGEGIAKEDLPNVFNRFYRSDRARSKNIKEGYGLGLSLAKEIAHMHKGKISVQSSPNKTTEFCMKFPLKG